MIHLEKRRYQGKPTIESHMVESSQSELMWDNTSLSQTLLLQTGRLNHLGLLKTKSSRIVFFSKCDYFKDRFLLQKNWRSEVIDCYVLGSILNASYSIIHLMHEPMRQVMLCHFVCEETEPQNLQVICPVSQEYQVDQEGYKFMPARQ